MLYTRHTVKYKELFSYGLVTHVDIRILLYTADYSLLGYYYILVIIVLWTAAQRTEMFIWLFSLLPS